MRKVPPHLILLCCVLITALAVVLKCIYNSLSYFNSVMLLTIMLTIGLKNIYTRIFSFLTGVMVLLPLVISEQSVESVIAQILLILVATFTMLGVFYIKRLYRTIQEEKRQMDILLSQRSETQRKLVIQNDQLEMVSTDIKRLNASLENKVEERTLILKEALQELERSQVDLSDALNKEKELNDIKSRFVSMASHEFRTPLSTIFSSAALIGKYTQTEDQDKRNKHLWRIRDSVQHLNGLLEDFLSLGKLEEGKILSDATQFDVKEWIQDICDELRGMIKEDQRVQYSYYGDPMFTTDKRLLKNILINLVSNAVKFSDAGTTISIDAVNNDSALEIDVKDQGIGIPEDDLQHLFSSFFRGKNVINIQGTGLGLSIVKKYADLLNGDISVTSELMKGTTFHLSLPLLTPKKINT